MNRPSVNGDWIKKKKVGCRKHQRYARKQKATCCHAHLTHLPRKWFLGMISTGKQVAWAAGETMGNAGAFSLGFSNLGRLEPLHAVFNQEIWGGGCPWWCWQSLQGGAVPTLWVIKPLVGNIRSLLTPVIWNNTSSLSMNDINPNYVMAVSVLFVRGENLGNVNV